MALLRPGGPARPSVLRSRGTDHLQGWRSIHVTGSEHPYMKTWWVPGTTIGYEHTFTNALADFLKGLESGMPASPTFRNALQTQLVLDAVLDSSKTGHWIDLPVL